MIARRPRFFAQVWAGFASLALTTACGGAAPPPPATENLTPVASSTTEVAAPGAPTGPKTVDDVASQIVQAINANRGEAVFALFAPPFAAYLPASKTVSFVTQVHTAFGTLGAKTRTNDPKLGSDGVYRVTAERGTCLMDVHLTATGEVIGLHVTAGPSR